ncbi:MAG TPA: ABC transporter substrate-binding protein [Yinghuangia sp.]|nr:ABC transporter substrate-binding protein [Yinghuangia sp.]
MRTRSVARLGLRRGLAAVLAALLVTVTACSDPGGEAAPVATGAGAAGALTVALPQEAASMDPLATNTYGAADGNRLAAVYDMLVWSDPATGTVTPQIAESLTPAEGGQVWTLRLRPGIRFTDGTPYDAEAVRFNWERHRDPTNRSLQLAATADISALRVLDPLTLQVRLARPNSNFDRSVARHLGFIVSPAAIRKDPVGIGREPVGAGPYILSEWTAGRQVFVRNPNYWQAADGLPRHETLTLVVDADPAHVTDEVAGGRLDASVLFRADARSHAAQGKLQVEQIRLDGGSMLIFNTAAAPFNDPETRKAAALALSSAQVDERFFGGEGLPARGVFSGSSPVANPQLAMTENQPDQARALFARATAGGTKPLRFVVVVPQAPLMVAIGEYIRDTLSAYPGVEMQVQIADAEDFITTVRKDDWGWSAALGQQWFSDPEPGLYNFFHSTSKSNLSGYHNPTVDKALADARTADAPAVRRDAYTRVQLEVNRDIPVWVFQESIAVAASAPDLGRVRLCNDGIVQWDRLGGQGRQN